MDNTTDFVTDNLEKMTTMMITPDNSTTSPVPTVEFLFDDPVQRIIVAVMFLIAALVGSVGNTIVIIAVCLSRKLRTVTNVFVVNLAVADLLTSLFVPWNAVALLSLDGWPLPFWICSVAGAITYLCISASFYSLASIAVNRFILITKGLHAYQRVIIKHN